ncbi:hypothetical protein ACKWTF_014095 [Chironomus riparius]
MIKSIQLAILLALVLQILPAKVLPPKSVLGYFRDKKFDDYELDLWTFTLKSSSVINSTEFMIMSRRAEAVKAFMSNNLKNIEFLPENVNEKFPNLANFEALNCSIKAVRKENFFGLQKLVKLVLDYNEIQELGANVFDDLIRLKTLSIQYNKIHDINAATFKNLKALHGLYIGHNKLKYLNKNLFENLLELRNLSMHYNHITYLGDEHLMHNSELEYMWLEHNDISHLSYTMFNYMEKLKFIDFSFNLHMWSGFVYEKNQE